MNRVQSLLVALCLVGMPVALPKAATVLPVEQNNAPLTAAPLSIGGRVVADNDGYAYQWPGVYFESAFDGTGAYFKLGPGEVQLHIRVDDVLAATLVKPAVGLYRIAGLAPGPHRLRIEVASEQQANAKQFGGIWLGPDAKALAIPKRQRQIEFIGDSHTVGYANTSSVRECSKEQIWATTDNTVAFGAVMAAHYQADYRINAISGRGIVRNYNGGKGDTLPEAYPYAILSHSARDATTDWQPQVIVVALGTNDFTTPLNPGEKWQDRDQLHRDFENTYVAFVRSLRARYAGARFILWATDMANGEIQAEAEKVVELLKQSGERRVAFVPVAGLAMTSCNWHPSAADSQLIAKKLMQEIARQPSPWPTAN